MLEIVLLVAIVELVDSMAHGRVAWHWLVHRLRLAKVVRLIAELRVRAHTHL